MVLTVRIQFFAPCDKMTLPDNILQKSSMGYRICSLCNGLLWATYDILTKSYNGLITHATLFAINLVSLMIFDVFGRRKKQP